MADSSGVGDVSGGGWCRSGARNSFRGVYGASASMGVREYD